MEEAASKPNRAGIGGAEAGSAAQDDQSGQASLYAWYCLLVMMAIYVNSYLDRNVLALLVDLIKADLDLSDTQIGILMGPTFALFYITAGLPIGYAVDRYSRRIIVIFGQVFWSLASIGCGLSSSFRQLMACRTAVGVGEASLSPSAYSMITDLFPRQRLATAISVYSIGIVIGSGLASLMGGLALQLTGTMTPIVLPIVGEVRPWQLVFLLIALPTLPLTLLMLTVREPQRRGVPRRARGDGVAEIPTASRLEYLSYVRKNWRAVAFHHLGYAWLSFSGYGASYWIPAYYMRIHGLEPNVVGYMLGIYSIAVGLLGVLLGGWLADKLLAMGFHDAKVRLGIITNLLWIPFGIAYPLMPSWMLAMAFMVPGGVISTMTYGVAPAGVQEMMPSRLRGQASAVFILVITATGLGLGPFALALCTDYLFRDEHMVHLSLITVSVVAHSLSLLFLFLARTPYVRTVEARDEWERKQGLGP